uniref:Protein sleepless n=1 Tax=Ascaris lumbricoides TaxID=6252 RepID=A0A0M3HSG3_ASCLU
MYRVVLVGSLLSIALPLILAESEQYVAEKCCGSTHAACCLESLRSNRPLHCDRMGLHMKITIIDCIQSEMYGSTQLNVLNFTDTTCCDVFTDNDNDAESGCEDVCVTVMQIAGLRNDRKLKKIKACLKRNPLYRCFLRCVEWNHKSSAPFIFEEHCSWRSKMLPGKLYLGDEVRM